MHPILAEQIAKQRNASFEREIDAATLAALARSSQQAPFPGLRERVTRSLAQVRLFVGGAPA